MSVIEKNVSLKVNIIAKIDEEPSLIKNIQVNNHEIFDTIPKSV